MWIELAIEVPSPAAEVLADAVGELTGGVELRDAETIVRVQGGRSLIVALTAPEAEADVLAAVEAACARLRAAGVSPDPMTLARREAHEDEWRDVWKRYFRTPARGQELRHPTELGAPGHGRRRSRDRHRSRARVRHGWARVDAAGDRDGRGARGSPRRSVSSISGAAPASCRWRRRCCGRARAGWPSTSTPRRWRPRSKTWRSTASPRSRRASGSLADVPLSPPCDVMLANIEATVLVPLAPAFPACLAPDAAVILSGLLAADVDPGVARVRGRRVRARGAPRRGRVVRVALAPHAGRMTRGGAACSCRRPG